jgi:hypothetical protein
MEREVAIVLIIVAAVGMVSLLAIVRRERMEARAAAAENQFAASTEGEKRCPKCGMGNLWTDATCITCGARLPG